MAEKITMDGKYRYRYGLPARVLCVDGGRSGYPVVSMTPNGELHTHCESGRFWNNRSLDLVPVDPEPKRVPLERSDIKVGKTVFRLSGCTLYSLATGFGDNGVVIEGLYWPFTSLMNGGAEYATEFNSDETPIFKPCYKLK